MVVTDAMGAEGSSVERERLPCAAGMSAGLRLLREMDLKLEKEVQDLEAWLAFVDQVRERDHEFLSFHPYPLPQRVGLYCRYYCTRIQPLLLIVATLWVYRAHLL
jgi:hypothetical protein